MSGTGGFQTQVNVQPAPAVEGQRASRNPAFSVLAGPGGLVAGPSGATIGRFCWGYNPLDPNGAPTVAQSFGAGPVLGFVENVQEGLNSTFLSFAGMTILKGIMVPAMSGGDFWVKNAGASEAQVGMKAYANLADGSVVFAATGAPTQGFSSTASIAASTSSVTGSISGNVMTVTAIGSGVVVPGTTISGTGVATGTQVVSQLTPLLAGEALGGIGRYYVSIPEQSVASTTISGTYGTMTVTAVGSGSLAVGDAISGSGVVAGTTITALGTGTGNTGTYIVNNNTVVGSTTITGVLNVETKWVAMSAGANGELVKISDHPNG